MEVKLIASDMDGTLLNDERLISKENKKSIRRAVDSGIIFTIATGRMFKSIVPFAEELELDIPLIAYNGALVQDAVTKEVLYDAPVELETALAILDYCRERNYYIQAYVNDTLLVHEASDFAKMYAEFAGVEFVEMGKDLFAIKRAPHKLLIMTG
ncbi:MAG TPA: HAD-IIB family hydrolase, partial [Candidatus Avacidaminococcus intestinavium]|nr:HAD-IIB family hydrolase [Candidatus Avacidaminococcus intestinavium]